MRKYLFAGSPVVFIVLLGLEAPLGAQAVNPHLEVDKAIMAEIYTSSEPMDNLEMLCDVYGSRFPGLPGDKGAVDYIVGKLEDYGCEKAHAEEFTSAGWTRGPATLEVLSPITRSFDVISLPHSIGAMSERDGSFTLAGLSEGTYRLWVSAPGFGSSENVVVESGAESVTVVLKRAGSVRGFVVDPGGQPLQEHFVRAYLVDRNRHQSGSMEQPIGEDGSVLLKALQRESTSSRCRLGISCPRRCRMFESKAVRSRTWTESGCDGVACFRDMSWTRPVLQSPLRTWPSEDPAGSREF